MVDPGLDLRYAPKWRSWSAFLRVAGTVRVDLGLIPVRSRFAPVRGRLVSINPASGTVAGTRPALLGGLVSLRAGLIQQLVQLLAVTLGLGLCDLAVKQGLLQIRLIHSFAGL